MQFESLIFIAIVFCFTVIHFIEISSYLARLSGVQDGSNALAYATQSAVFMATRFFSMLLLPMLGLVVDLKVSPEKYLTVVATAICCAFLASMLAMTIRGRLIASFHLVVCDVRDGQSLLLSLAKVPFRVFGVRGTPSKIGALSSHFLSRIFWFAAVVFSIYATSIFVAFYFGLIFPEYRTSISQLSAVTNALATVLLTFYIEPKISVAIDKGDDPAARIYSMLLGRLLGLGVLAYLPVIFLWLAFGKGL